MAERFYTQGHTDREAIHIVGMSNWKLPFMKTGQERERGQRFFLGNSTFWIWPSLLYLEQVPHTTCGVKWASIPWMQALEISPNLSSLLRLPSSGADPGFWSRGAQHSLSPIGGLSPICAKNKDFSLQNASKLRDFEKILVARGGLDPLVTWAPFHLLVQGPGCVQESWLGFLTRQITLT